MPPSPKKYKTTLKGVFGWAQGELEHVGRIAAIEDRDIQYSYALSTVNGMLHLRNAVYELLHNERYQTHEEDLQRLYDQVNRAVQHLINDYDVERRTIERFNTRRVLGEIRNLHWPAARVGGKTRRNRKVNRKTRRN
jgi:hypothetical protein